MKHAVEDAIVCLKEMKNNDERYMREALKEAKKAYNKLRENKQSLDFD